MILFTRIQFMIKLQYLYNSKGYKDNNSGNVFVFVSLVPVFLN